MGNAVVTVVVKEKEMRRERPENRQQEERREHQERQERVHHVCQARSNPSTAAVYSPQPTAHSPQPTVNSQPGLCS